MELSKQDMELYLLLPDIQSKYFFYIMFLTLTNELQIVFLKNRKLNYSDRKWKYFSYSLSSNRKHFFLYKMFLTFTSRLNLDFNSTSATSQTWVWHNSAPACYCFGSWWWVMVYEELYRRVIVCDSGWRWMMVYDGGWASMMVDDGLWWWMMVYSGWWCWVKFYEGIWRWMSVMVHDGGWW